MDNETLITLTADIVSAHVSNNRLSPDDVPALIQSVFAALSNAANPAPIVAEVVRPQPAVSIRSSVKPDAIACLECGARFKTLKKHLNTEHGFTAEEYRARWSLGADYPLVAPDYTARRSEMAQKIGLGRKPKAAAPKAKAAKAPRAAKNVAAAE